MLLKLVTEKDAQYVTSCKFGLKFKKSVYSGCHDLLKLSLDISDITIIPIKSIDYRCIVPDAIKSTQFIR